MVRSLVARARRLRCVALAVVDASALEGRTDDQYQANPMVLSALEEARYARSPSYGYEDHGSVLSPPIPNLYRWKSRSTRVVRHGKKSMALDILCKVKDAIWNTLAKA